MLTFIDEFAPKPIGIAISLMRLQEFLSHLVIIRLCKRFESINFSTCF